jgi:hypothetical protein
MKRLREAARLYWVGSAGYRLRPWNSPYLRWRLETFLGPEAAVPGLGRFLRLLWRERARLGSYLDWVAERRAVQRSGQPTHHRSEARRRIMS